MSLQFVDGANHYGTADILKKWSALGGTQVSVYAANPRRTGLASLQILNGYLETDALDASQRRTVVGVAMRIGYTTSEGSITFYNGTTAQMCLVWDGTQKLTVKRGDASSGVALASTATGAIPVGSWFYVEFMGYISDTVGELEVRLNGSTILGPLTGLDTRAGTEVGAEQVRISANTSGLQICDVFIDDTDFHGDCVVDTILPTGAGTHTDFTPSTGSNYENVDDAAAIDGDGTYNSSNTQGDTDSFAYGNVPSMPGSSIVAVVANLVARKDDTAQRSFTVLSRISATDYEHPTSITLLGTYGVKQRVWTQNPNDLAPWEEADVNGAEFGYKQSLII